MSDQTQFHEEHCPECNAPRVQGLSCWEMLGLLIAWEYDDPDLRAEHFLTVASYNLQHPAQFTEAALTGLQAVFIRDLLAGIGGPHPYDRIGVLHARHQLAKEVGIAEHLRNDFGHAPNRAPVAALKLVQKLSHRLPAFPL